MAPYFAFVAFLIFQPSVANCAGANVADDTQCLLQTDANVKRRRGARESVGEAVEEVGEAAYDTDSMPSLDMEEVEQKLLAQGKMPQETVVNSLIAVNEEERSDLETKPAPAKAKKSFIPRPNVGKGPDLVTFGMLAKTFYGLNVKKSRFTIDLVLTLMWEDKRTVSLIPKGAANITLSEEEANKKIWLPEIAVTNRDVHKYQVISTAVELHRDGHVVKVQRVEVRVKDNYQLAEYPFDSQDLPVQIASSVYMDNAVKLVPSTDDTYSGFTKSLLVGTGFNLKDWTLTEVEDNTGLLKKSRGVFSIMVDRGFSSYLSTHLLPTIFIGCLSCGVFFFPFIAPFVVPRLMMSIIAYLVFTNLKNRSEAALPGDAPNTWNDVLNTNIMLVMLVTAFMNVYTEVRFHVSKCQDVAAKMNNEMKIIAPLSFNLIVLIAMVCGACHADQAPVDITLKVLIAVFVLAYAVLCEYRTKEAVKAEEKGLS